MQNATCNRKMDKDGKVQKSKYVTRVKVMIMRSNAYLQTMAKGPANFQIVRYKTVGRVAHTKYHL